MALATTLDSTLLAIPARQSGQVQLVHLPPLSHDPPLPPPPSHDPLATPYASISIIVAHSSPLAALATTESGSLVATASSKGTLVRIWDVTSAGGVGVLLRELRRGTDSAIIFGISLRADGGRVAVSSDKGTVHVWHLNSKEDEKRRGADKDTTSE